MYQIGENTNMGEMADYYLDTADYFDDDYWEIHHAEKTMVPNSIKPIGPGKCPLCNGETHLVEGKFGSFYGCNGFPKCKGSRNYA